MRQKHLFTSLTIVMLAVSSACQVFGGQNPATTLEANNNAFIAEATNVAITANAYSTQVMATAGAVETQVAQISRVNQHLLATVIAGSSATPRVVVGNADPSNGSVSSIDSGQQTVDGVVSQTGGGDTTGTQFTEIGTAGSVRQSDGCANGLQSQFALDSNSIYITGRAFNLTAGTVMSAEWIFNGTVVVANSPWNVDQNYDDICVWFFISQDDTTFTPGDWSVRLLANNTPIEPSVSFTIVGQ